MDSACRCRRHLPRGGIADPGVIAVKSADAVAALARFKAVLSSTASTPAKPTRRAFR
jgi:hypothetical protein